MMNFLENLYYLHETSHENLALCIDVKAAILYNLKSRHVKGKPYTRTGDIVIAVNPYEWIHSLYTPAKREQYARKIIWDFKKTQTTVINQ